jgi:gas vesicle protein GvpL/GvpF
VAEPAGVWLYAITEGIPATGLSRLVGVGGMPVRAITSAGLAAIASNVGLDEFGEEALRVNLDDMTWLEATATAHHRVIDAMSRAQPVVPMRLATVYSGDTKVHAMLGQRGDDLREVLSRISARQEWGVKAYAAGVLAVGLGASAGGPGRGLAGSGAEYLRRRREELVASKQARQEVLVSAERVHQALSRLASASRLHPPQAPVLAGTRATMILNAAYLLDEARHRQFSETVQQLAAQHPAVQLQLTGPWPPYSFASLEKDGHAEDGQ